MLNSFPVIKYGLLFRFVEITDAEFILSLRTDDKLSLYLNKTSQNIQDQINWINDYKKREVNKEEFYVICCSPDNEIKFGVNRIYNIKNNSFEIGSWLFRSNIGNSIAIVSDLFCRSFFFNQTNFTKCVFEVRRKNKKVLKYHKMFSPRIISEDENNFYFELDKDNFIKHKNKLIKLLGYDK
jgi:hypothetical protein